MNEWVSVGKYGLRYRTHDTKTTGVGRMKRPLRYYVSVYKWKGKTVTDVYGWEGADFRNEDEIVTVALELRQNRRNLTPPFTVKERLALRQAAIDEVERAREEERAQQEREERNKLDKVFELYRDSNSHKKSLKDEMGYYRNWIGPAIGNKRLDQIVLLDLERIRKQMADAGKAPRSIQYVKNIVRQTYHFAIAHKMYAGEIPTLHFLRKMKIDNKRQRYLTPEEARLLLDEIRKHSENTYRISLLSLNSGLRFGEIAALRWQHINTGNREIMIIDPKNGESRNVFMTAAVLEMFNGMACGKPDELVFPARYCRNEESASSPGEERDGRNHKMSAISNVFERAVVKLGLNDGITDRRMRVVFHTLRHSCASWLVNSGVELPVIAKILGHKTLAMTMRYAHVNDTSVRNAMNVLDDQQQSAGKIVSLIGRR